MSTRTGRKGAARRAQERRQKSREHSCPQGWTSSQLAARGSRKARSDPRVPRLGRGRENWFKVCPGSSRIPRSSPPAGQPGGSPCPHRRKEGKWTFWRETLKVGRWDHTGSEGTEWSPHTEQRVFCPHQAPSPHWDPRTQSLRRRDEPELRASSPAVGIPQ